MNTPPADDPAVRAERDDPAAAAPPEDSDSPAVGVVSETVDDPPEPNEPA
jgi:hypothetical protein